MKILYVANQRRAAQLAAHALRNIAPDVKVTWAGSLSPALRWVQENTDVAALIVEAEVQGQGCTTFLDHVRGLGLTIPILIAAQERMGAPSAELRAGADDYIIQNSSFLAELPSAVTRVLGRMPLTSRPARASLRLLYVGDATLARKCLESFQLSIDITEAMPASNGPVPAVPPGFDVVLVEHDHPGLDAFKILKDIADRQPHVRTVLVVEWDEKLAIPALKLGATDYVVKAADSFRALFFKLDRLRAVPAPVETVNRAELNLQDVASRERLERQLRDALAAASDTQRSFDTAAEHFRQSEARLQAAIEQERAARGMLEAKLAGATQIDGPEGTAELGDAVARQTALEAKIAELESAVARAEERRESEAAAAHQAALEARIADLERAIAAAEERREAEAAAAANQLADRSEEFKISLAHVIHARDALKQELSDVATALDEIRQIREAERVAAAERFTEREAELAASLAERESVAQTAAARQAKLEEQLAQEGAQRATLAKDLADAEAARRAAEEAVARQKLLEARIAELEHSVAATEDRREAEAAAAATQLSERSDEFTISLAHVIHTRDALKQELSDVATALDEVRQVREAEGVAAAERLTEREAELAASLAERATMAQAAIERQTKLEEQLAEVGARRATLERDLAEAETARRVAAERDAEALAAAKAQLADGETQHGTAMGRAAKVRAALERRLLELETALQQAEERREAEAATAADHLAQRHEEFTANLAHAARSRDALSQQLTAATSALEETRQHRETDAAAAAELLARREAELGAMLAQSVDERLALEQKLANGENELHQAERRATSERAAAAREAAQHEEALAELEERRAQEASRRADLEQKILDAETARDDAERHHAMELAAAAARIADNQTKHDATVARATRLLKTLELSLLGLEARLEQAEEHRLSAAAAAAATLAERESEFASSLAHVTHSRELLALQLSVSTAALEDSRQDRASEAATAAERYHALDERFAQEVTAREAVVAQLSASAAALDESRQMLASEATAAAARLADREAELGATLAESAAARSALERQLSENERRLAQNEQQLVENTRQLETSEQRLAGNTQQLGETQQRLETNARQLATSIQELAETGRKLTEIELQLAVSEQELDSNARRLAVSEQELESNARKLADSERQVGAHVEQLANNARALAENQATLHQTEERATAALAAAALRYSELEERLAQEVSRRATIEQSLADAEAARAQADARHATELTTAAARLAEVQAQSDARLAEAAAAHDQLAQTLSETSATLADSRRQVAAAADRQATTEARLAQELDERGAVEHELANARVAQRETEERHVAAMAEAATTRDGLEQQLRAALAAIEESRQQRSAEAAAAAEHLARRQAEHEVVSAEAGVARTALERALADAETLHRQTQLRAASDLSAAATRRDAVEADLRQEITYRQAVERDLTEARLESAKARRRLLTRALGIRRRASEHNTEVEAQRQQERAEYLQTIAERSDVIRDIQLDAQALRQALSTAQDQLHRLNDTLEQEREAHEQERLTRDAELRRVSAESEQVRHTLDQVSTAFQALEIVSSQHASERARLDIIVAEREAQLAAQASRHGAAQEAAASALRQNEEKLRATQEASRHDITLLHGELSALRQALEATTGERDLLQIDADRVPVLQTELDQSQNDHRRQFERAPVGMWRCGRDGAITHANRSLVGLLGYRTADELRSVDLATKIFESADDLRWLIERSVDTGTTELLETTWRRKDRGRLVVRLQAVTVGSDSIEIVAEDITELRAVEDKLRQAQRMEAVGRLASEVAVTCDNLLRDVTQDGQQWLAAIDSDPVLRHQGEQLLGEVTRAASFLRQLGVYGERQVNALEPVSMNRVLRDMEAVLKRVAGDDIELILPKGAPALDLDVETERVERVLVNVASYARERMPAGGRLKIDLAPVVADRRFIAKYPNVRPGDHVLITVTEVPGAARSDRADALQPEQAARTTPSDRPGVDLGALLALIGECGGHLWMAAEPPGNMVLKIHLPRRGSDNAPETHQAGTRPERGAMSRWFRH